ncbi:GntR family transcriptional regulator [Arthrobacter sp. CDRTa11]|uniref:GntR family transcriptional regulator n=1 Tax=Arthrobacter sp. CDRTa11 TaxID=2651199 RepID=UPI002265D315|nr:GntR family transcriptional regulator [Arthrobacter sp. CDRTa11]UZX03039.1 GntR family transcriptional regulator [Arthrobacter sp. CDRTa11]
MSDPAVLEGLPRPTFSSPRATSLELHSHLRQLITDSLLPPGAILKQAELARVFDVSRTPMREAFRMLQEEGLIEADLNQRAKVKGLDALELDQLYGARICLESLGCRMSTGKLTAEESQEARECLEEMDKARKVQDMSAWMDSHRRFHSLCMSRVSEPLRRTIDSYAQRSERYLRLFQLWHPQSFDAALKEHELILEAVEGMDPQASGSLMAKHLSRTALRVIQDVSPESDALAIREGLAMATGARSRQK